MGVLAISSSSQAEDLRSLVERDAVQVSVDDGYVGDEISQVGFMDSIWSDSTTRSSCDGCGERSARCCCAPWWSHRCGVFGEFLLLRPGNVDQVYTIEQDTVVPGDSPTGPVGRLNVDEEAAYRVGFTICASPCTSLVASWTQFEGSTSNQIRANGDNVLNSQIIHPSTLTTGAASLQSGATYDIDFQLFDLAYRHIFKACDTYAINWLAGFRYGQMSQDLLTGQEVSVATGLVTNKIDVDFDGFGMIFGLDAERRSPCTGMMVYSKALTSFLGGDWKGSYVQQNQFDGGVVANNYEDYRVTPVLELELGLGWRSPCGRCRASVGYMTSAWYDAVSTRQYVDAVRNNDYISVDETVTFSGLTTRIEANF
jgi:hypothetical protein